jgi:sugar/nucleoside kinase (ribokinase family)
MRGSSAVLVHISITHRDLAGYQDQIAAVLRDSGDDVTVSMVPESGHSHLPDSATNKVRQADALVCLVGPADGLRADGTAPGEDEVAQADELGIPVSAYQLSLKPASGGRPTDARSGYGRARLERFRRELRETHGLHEFRGVDELVRRLRVDIEQTRRRLRFVAPDAIRAMHRRLRAHPLPQFDAFAVSMQNMDHLYWVDEVIQNRELPATFLGRRPGGAGANAMVALSQLGLTTGVAGVVGDDDDGRALRADLEQHQANSDLLLIVDGDGLETGRAIVVVDRHLAHTIFASGGVNGQLAAEIERRALRSAVTESMTRSRIVHCSPLLAPPERELQEELLARLPTETVVTYKPGTTHATLGADRLEATLSRCDVLFVSEDDLDLLLRRSPRYDLRADVATKLDGLFAWRERQGHRSPIVVVVTFGLADVTGDPLYLCWGSSEQEGGVGTDRPQKGSDSQAPRDPSGTRDATVAGVLFGLLRARTPVDCANLAYVLAMSVATEYGCREGLPRRRDVREKWRHWMQVQEPPRWLDPYG